MGKTSRLFAVPGKVPKTSTLVPTGLDRHAFAAVLSWYQDRGLISSAEADGVLACFAPGYPFAAAMGLADSFHVHTKVDDVMRLPHGDIVVFGGRVEYAKDGYIKYAQGAAST